MKHSPTTALVVSLLLLPLQQAHPDFIRKAMRASVKLPDAQKPVSKAAIKVEGSGKVVLNAEGQNYTLQGAEKLKADTESGIPLHVEFAKAPGDGLAVKNFTAESVGLWLDTVGMQYGNSPDREKAKLYRQTVSLRRKIDQNVTQPAENQDWAGLYQQYGMVLQLANEAQANETDATLRAELATFQNSLEQEQRTFLANKLKDEATSKSAKAFFKKNVPVGEKRFYRLNDNYRPEIYPLIFAHSSACVAIVRDGTSTPHGSGALIGPNLVLTCKHNIDENTADDFEGSSSRVWLDFEERRISTRKLNTRVFLAKEVYRSSSLDFSLLEIRQHAEEPIESAAQLPPATDMYTRMVDLYPGIGQSRPILPLNENSFPRWTPVFVVGHPNGNARIVHDSSWLLFPHQLRNKSEWGYIQGQVTKDYRDFEFLSDEEAADKALQFMEGAYGKLQPDKPKTVYTLTQDNEQYMGIESDTFEGDSGAPVMLRENGSLIGILYKGVGDSGQDPNTDQREPNMRLMPSADNHERVLPMKLILGELRAQNLYPDWKAQVTIAK